MQAGSVTSPAVKATPGGEPCGSPRPTAITSAPAAANPPASARPIPLVAPVTSTRRPEKSALTG